MAGLSPSNWWDRLASTVAVIALVGTAEFLAARDPRFPALSTVAPALWRDAGALASNTSATVASALVGLCIGAVAGFIAGTVAGLAVGLRTSWLGSFGGAGFLALAALEALPLVVVAPAVSAAMDIDSARVSLAAIGVLFPIAGITLVARTSSALAGPVAGARLLARLHGKRRLRSWVLVDARPAVDAALAGVRITVPAAMLGSLVAEFFGADTGIGVFVLNSLAQNRLNDVWAGCVWLSLCTAVPVGLLGLLQRKLRWENQAPHTVASGPSPSRLGQQLLTAGVLAVVLLSLWCLGAAVLGDFGAIPWPVDLLAWVDRPSADVTELRTAIAESLWHWAVAFASGVVGALGLAMLAWRFRPVRHLMLATLLGLRATPLLIVIPVVASVFGRGLGVVMIAGALATLLPAITAILLGLDRAPQRLLEMARGHAVAPRRTLRYILLPYALNSLRSALPLIAPMALAGVIFAEWLATGDGLGTLVVTAQARLDAVMSWTVALVVVALSCLAALGLSWLADHPEVAWYRDGRSSRAETGQKLRAGVQPNQ